MRGSRAAAIALCVMGGCTHQPDPGSDLLPTAQQLTFEGADDRRPAWSPDGSWLAFESRRDGNWEIYVVGIDGDGLRRLTDHPGADRRPAWFADGSAIVFESDRAGSVDLWRLEVGGGLEPVRITSGAGEEVAPAVSPDGTQLAFASSDRGDFDIFVAGVDGAGAVPLTGAPADEHWPAWSPDGSMLVYFSSRDSADALFAVASDGSGERRLTDHPANDFAPDWSPRPWIVFASMRGGDSAGIYRVHFDSGAVEKLIGLSGHCTEPAVSPDGSRLAVACRPPGPREEAFYDLFVVAGVWEE